MKKTRTRSLSLVLSVLILLSATAEAKRKGDSGGSGSTTDSQAILSFASDRMEVLAGETVQLSWASAHTRFCTASGDWDGKHPTAGTWRSPPLDGPKSFHLKCASKRGGVTSSISITLAEPVLDPVVEADPIVETSPEPDPVIETSPEHAPVEADPVVETSPEPDPAEPEPIVPPTVALNPSDQSVESGSSVTLNWSSTDASNCSASGGWNGERSPSGSEVIDSLSASTTFSLSCSGAGGTAVQMVSVGVLTSLELSWVAPSENVDGTVLTDLVGYRIYYGNQSRSYSETIEITDPTTTAHAFSAVTGDYYLAMTAVDQDDNESAYSNEILKTAP